MTPEALVAAAKLRIEADPDGHGLLDRCSLVGPTFVDGGASGDSVAMGTIASNVECLIEPLRQSHEIVVGGETFTVTHRLHMIKKAATQAITPRYKIPVAARAGTPQLVFEKPVIIDETLNPLVSLWCVLVKQGHQI